jgi:hypothetical protein
MDQSDIAVQPWRAHHGAVMTRLLVPAALLAVALAAGGCGRAGPDGPSAAATSTAAATASSLAPAPDGWPLFTSAAGGYRLRYPPGWRISESSGSGGPVLSLLPPRGPGISLLATTSPPPDPAAGSAAIRCQPVKVGALDGRRCLDPGSMVVTTTLRGEERWFVLTGAPRDPPEGPAGAYDRVLASFRLR